MEGWHKWLIVLGGLTAVLGQFWGGPGMSPNLYLPLVGGAVAAIVGLMQ